MRVGVPRELKNHEYRVGLTPASVREVVRHGHEVVVEGHAGEGIGVGDDEYVAAGAQIASRATEVYETAELIVKVKGPEPVERALLRRGQLLFAYLHLASDREQLVALVESEATCIAYETVTSPRQGLPLLAPMSKVAGRMAVQAGAHCLERPHGGRGVLMGGVPGVVPAKVVVLGGGVVGTHATYIAVGMGAEVWVVDRDADVLEAHWRHFGRSARTLFATPEAIEGQLCTADLIVCGVLIPGAATPKLITADMVRRMKPGAVIVDVAIDQGGCAETSRPTTHADPTYVIDDVVHYCVANMPGAVPQTATHALNNVTLPYLLTLADKGYRQALIDDPHLRAGLNVHAGHLTCRAVAEAFGEPFQDPLVALRA